MKITILTLFPEYFTSVLSTSILKRAVEKQLVQFEIINIRDFATDARRTTDDRPFGGGAGMVLLVEPIDRALQSLETGEQHVVLTSAQGKIFDQSGAQRLATHKHLVLICGHYEGVDERVTEQLVDEEIRIGDYVLTGGEPAVAVMIDSIVRLVPGVLGNDQSLVGESHEEPGQLGYPQYSRPQNYNGWEVPEVLLSGNHAAITDWRVKNRKSGK